MDHVLFHMIFFAKFKKYQLTYIYFTIYLFHDMFVSHMLNLFGGFVKQKVHQKVSHGINTLRNKDILNSMFRCKQKSNKQSHPKEEEIGHIHKYF